MKRLALLSALFLVVIASAPLWAQRDSVRIVVNSANPVSSMSRVKIAQFFLKKTTNWEHGPEVVPVDQVDTAPVRAGFSEDVLRKSISEVKAYWEQQIFSGRKVPPVKVPSDDRVIEYVRSRPGAIGYVSGSASTEGVKVVTVSDDG